MWCVASNAVAPYVHSLRVRNAFHHLMCRFFDRYASLQSVKECSYNTIYFLFLPRSIVSSLRYVLIYTVHFFYVVKRIGVGLSLEQCIARVHKNMDYRGICALYRRNTVHAHTMRMQSVGDDVRLLLTWIP